MTQRYFPFHELGLHGNPFRVLTLEERVATAVLPVGVRAALAEGPRHLQLLGERGRGKSTTLLALTDAFRRQGQRAAYEYLPEGRHRFQTNPAALDIFLLDEAQRLNWRQRRRLLAAAASTIIILGAHDDWRGRFQARGRQLHSVNLDHLSPNHLRAILEQRLAYASRVDPPPYHLTSGLIAYLRRSYGSDVRAMILILYETFQTLPPPGELTTAQVATIRKALDGQGGQP